jgi:hypothetical protein
VVFTIVPLSRGAALAPQIGQRWSVGSVTARSPWTSGGGRVRCAFFGALERTRPPDWLAVGVSASRPAEGFNRQQSLLFLFATRLRPRHIPLKEHVVACTYLSRFLRALLPSQVEIKRES